MAATVPQRWAFSVFAFHKNSEEFDWQAAELKMTEFLFGGKQFL